MELQRVFQTLVFSEPCVVSVGAYDTMKVVATLCLKTTRTSRILAFAFSGTMPSGPSVLAIDSLMVMPTPSTPGLTPVSIAVSTAVNDVSCCWRMEGCSSIAMAFLKGDEITVIFGCEDQQALSVGCIVGSSLGRRSWFVYFRWQLPAIWTETLPLLLAELTFLSSCFISPCPFSSGIRSPIRGLLSVSTPLPPTLVTAYFLLHGVQVTPRKSTSTKPTSMLTCASLSTLRATAAMLLTVAMISRISGPRRHGEVSISSPCNSNVGGGNHHMVQAV